MLHSKYVVMQINTASAHPILVWLMLFVVSVWGWQPLRHHHWEQSSDGRQCSTTRPGHSLARQTPQDVNGGMKLVAEFLECSFAKCWTCLWAWNPFYDMGLSNVFVFGPYLFPYLVCVSNWLAISCNTLIINSVMSQKAIFFFLIPVMSLP